MHSAHPAALIGALLLVAALKCQAQLNVDSSLSGSVPLTGYRIATVRYSTILDVGKSPWSVRILGGEYWTDAAGQAIPWAAGRSSDRHHQFTRIVLGRSSLWIPLPPAALGVVVMAAIFVLGLSVFALSRWRGSALEESTAKDLPSGWPNHK